MKRRINRKRAPRRALLDKLAEIQVQLREIDDKVHHLIANFRDLRRIPDLLRTYLNDYLD